MIMEAIKNNTGELSEKQNTWFIDVIHSIKSDHMLLDNGVASEDTKEFYEDVISGNSLGLSKKIKGNFDQVIIKDLVIDFIKELIRREQKEIKLSFNVNGPELLVWAEIKDDDDKMEADLFLSEAKINAKYRDYNYSINTTVVEESDNITPPPHYVDFE